MDYAYDSIHNSECLFAVYIDLSYAVYAVNHSILVKNLQHFGVRAGEFLIGSGLI